MTGYINKEVAERIIDSDRSKEQMLQMLEQTPTADVRENVHGEWIHKDGIYGVVFCNKCDYELHINNTNFCPNCGAYMLKEAEEWKIKNLFFTWLAIMRNTHPKE